MVSIIIINYNTYHYTRQCIESLYKEVDLSFVEIIMVDNASTEEIPSGFFDEFPLVQFVQSNENIGFARGNNLGISIAKGEFILLLNSDTVVLNDVSIILSKFLHDNKYVAAVSGLLQYPDGRIQHCCQRFPSVKYKLIELLRIQKLFSKEWAGRMLLGSFFNHQEFVFPDWIWGTCFMFRKEILEKLPKKRLAEDFFMYGEDMQWCMDFRKLGYRVAYQPAAKVIHLMGGSGGSKKKLMQENGKRFMQMYYAMGERFLISILNKLL